MLLGMFSVLPGFLTISLCPQFCLHDHFTMAAYHWVDPPLPFFYSVLDPLLDLIATNGQHHYFPYLFKEEDPDLWERTTREDLQGDSSHPGTYSASAGTEPSEGLPVFSAFTACGWPWLSGFTSTGESNADDGQWQPRFPLIFIKEGRGRSTLCRATQATLGKSRSAHLKLLSFYYQ